MTSPLRLLGGRRLQSPAGLGTRPTTALVREAVMNILRNKLNNCNWLDLCSGSGVMSCEALERGARRIVAVERDKRAMLVCKENLNKTASGISKEVSIEVIRDDVVSWLKKGPQNERFNKVDNHNYCQFDLVYLDPPYGSKIYIDALEQLNKGNWLKEDSIVICEHASYMDLPTPANWVVHEKRLYGKSALLLISPPENPPFGIDSMHLRTSQAQ